MISWIIQIFRENIQNFAVTNAIAKMDLRRLHNNSDLGIFWAVAKPLIYLFMFYFTISLGFRSAKNIDGSLCPYFIWLAAGIVQWQLISDVLVWGAGCFQRHVNIVRNTKFPLTTVPMMPVLSRFYIYLAMVAMLIVAAVCMDVKPSVYWLQIPIYMLLSVMFCYIWVMLMALLNTISGDFLEFLKVIRTAFFWLSGILFNVHGSESLFFRLNPISYLVEGFRNCFAYHIWIWEEGKLFLYFAIVMAVLTTISYLLYRRLEKRIPELV